MKKIEHCPVCNSESFSSFLTCKDQTVSKEVFSILACKNCSFKFTSPRPNDNDLGKYYISEDYVSHSNTSKGIINSIYQKVRNYTLLKKLALINSFGFKEASLLDVGCGTGEFLNTCKNNNWKTKGIEPSDAARKFAEENYQLDVYTEDKINGFSEQEFNVVSMWHVLEHVPNLNERIQEIKRILNNKGVLIIAVPNCNSHDANYYKELWAAYDVPRHLWHFTPETITKLMQNNGFSLMKILPMKFDSYYVSMLSEKYKGSSLGFLKGFLRGFISNSRAAKNKYSSQIYLFSKTN